MNFSQFLKSDFDHICSAAFEKLGSCHFFSLARLLQYIHHITVPVLCSMHHCKVLSAKFLSQKILQHHQATTPLNFQCCAIQFVHGKCLPHPKLVLLRYICFEIIAHPFIHNVQYLSNVWWVTSQNLTSPVSDLLSHASCLISFVSLLMFYISLSHTFCKCLLPHVFCRIYKFFCSLTPVSHTSYITSPVSLLMFYISCLTLYIPCLTPSIPCLMQKVFFCLLFHKYQVSKLVSPV